MEVVFKDWRKERNLSVTGMKYASSLSKLKVASPQSKSLPSWWNVLFFSIQREGLHNHSPCQTVIPLLALPPSPPSHWVATDLNSENKNLFTLRRDKKKFHCSFVISLLSKQAKPNFSLQLNCLQISLACEEKFTLFFCWRRLWYQSPSILKPHSGKLLPCSSYSWKETNHWLRWEGGIKGEGGGRLPRSPQPRRWVPDPMMLPCLYNLLYVASYRICQPFSACSKKVMLIRSGK